MDTSVAAKVKFIATYSVLADIGRSVVPATVDVLNENPVALQVDLHEGAVNPLESNAVVGQYMDDTFKAFSRF